MCLVGQEKAFDKVPRILVEWAMKKKGFPEVLVGEVMSLYDGLKTKFQGYSCNGQ